MKVTGHEECIDELTVAWELEYWTETRPMDILLIGGLENIANGAKNASIMTAYEHFVKLVMTQSDLFHPETPNTCGIATMIYPPKLCWLEDDGNTPDNYVNKYEQVRSLNLHIEDLNERSGVKVPNFTTHGIRKNWNMGRPCTKHRWEQWREEGRSSKLNLKDSVRIKIVRQIEKYFQFVTKH